MHTPFECVGTHDECLAAASLARGLYLAKQAADARSLCVDHTDTAEKTVDCENANENAKENTLDQQQAQQLHSQLPWFFREYAGVIDTSAGEGLANSVLTDVSTSHQVPPWFPLGLSQ
jgi:hypothetical protein